MRTAVKHPYVLVWHNMHCSVLNVSKLDKVCLKSKNPWVAEREADRGALPVDAPLRPCSPAVTVDEERELRVVEEELAVESLDVDRLNILLARDKVKRRVGLIEQGLCLECFQGDDFEAASTSDTKLRLEEVHR